MVATSSFKTDTAFSAKASATKQAGVFGNSGKQYQKQTTNKNKSQSATAFEKALNQSSTPKTETSKKKVLTPPSKSSESTDESTHSVQKNDPSVSKEKLPVTTATSPAPLDTSLAFASVVQEQLAANNTISNTSAPLTEENQKEANLADDIKLPPQPINTPLPIQQQESTDNLADDIKLPPQPINTPLPIQQQESTDKANPKNEDFQQEPSSEKQETTENDDNQPEAFLSNEDNQKSNNLTSNTANEAVAPLNASTNNSLPLLQPNIALLTPPLTNEVPVNKVTSIVAQVGGQMEYAISNGAGNKQVTMVLQPEALGSVRVQLQQAGNQSVSGKIIVQTPEAYAALNQQLDGLKARMEGQGVTVQKLEIILAPTAENLILESQHHQALLEASSGGGAFNEDTASKQSQSGQADANLNEDPEPFSMDKYRQPSEQSWQEGDTTANQQDRKEAYQAHLNELRGLRSYRLAMKTGNENRSQYA